MGRRARPKPKDLSAQWPDSPLDDPALDAVRRYAMNLSDAIGDRPLRAIAELTQLDHVTLGAILRGDAWPDAITVARTEQGLGARLWDGPTAPPKQ